MSTSYFPHPLQGEFLDNGRSFLLTEDFIFEGEAQRIVVPAGFVTDFNSVPRGLWNFFPPWEYPEAGVVHDYLYRYNGISRADADAIHRRILELKGCPWFKRQAAYYALRIGGSVPWNRYREAEKDTQ